MPNDGNSNLVINEAPETIGNGEFDFTKIIPENPSHFQVFPSTYPKTYMQRLKNQQELQTIEATWVDLKGQEMEQYILENEEREHSCQVQNATNAYWLDQIENGASMFNQIKQQILSEQSCKEGSIEYEIALALALKPHIQKLFKVTK